MPQSLRDKTKRLLLVLGVALPLAGGFVLAPVADGLGLSGPWALAVAWTLMLTGLSCGITWLFVRDEQESRVGATLRCPACGHQQLGRLSKQCAACGEWLDLDAS